MTTTKKLGILGLERMLINKLTKLVSDNVGGQHEVTKFTETDRGTSFDVRICEPGQPSWQRVSTGRIARVAIELDRVEQPAGEGLADRPYDDDTAGDPEHNRRADEKPVEQLETSRGDWDEDGFHLRLETDEDDHHFRLGDVETARQLLAAVGKLADWVAEHDRERAAYERAAPEERAKVLFGRVGAEALEATQQLLDAEVVAAEVDDDALREAADHRRKYAKENPE